jgi:AraC family transcriptional activator of pobA
MNILPFKYFASAGPSAKIEQYHADYHIHILVEDGTMTFSDGKNEFRSGKNDVVIWQKSNSIQNVRYSEDFKAEFFIASPTFVMSNNPVMTWATKGFVLIRMNPSMHLEGDNLETIRDDFSSIRKRFQSQQDMFKLDIIGKLFSIFLYDLWKTYNSQLCESDVDDNSAKIFLRFTAFVQRDCKSDRLVSHYADLLCITPKYLNQVCIKVTNTSASKWIAYYTNYELIRLLDNPDKTLADIAFEMNFSSGSFFTRYTKKHLGVTPSEYRRKKM